MKKYKILIALATILSVLMVLWFFLFLAAGVMFGLSSGVNITQMLPFLFLSVIQLSVLLAAIRFFIKHFKGNSPSVENHNNKLGAVLILAGVIYFLYSFISVLYGNISGSNPGAWLQPVLALFWCAVLVALGLIIRRK